MYVVESMVLSQAVGRILCYFSCIGTIWSDNALQKPGYFNAKPLLSLRRCNIVCAAPATGTL